MLQTLSFALVVAEHSAAVGVLALFGTALSSFTLLGLVVWIASRSPSRSAARAPSESRAPAEVPVASAPVVPAAVDEEPVAAPAEAPASPPGSGEPAAAGERGPSLEAIAHDINDLMTVVVAQAELLRERHAGRNTDELEPILDAAHRLSGVARKLVAFAERQRQEAPATPRGGVVGPGIARARSRPAPARDSSPSILDAVEAVRDESVVRESSPAISVRRRVSEARRLVLLVEDEHVLLRATRRMLEQRDYRVITASTGAEALEVARQNRGLEALITDLSLPGMNGMELARRLRLSLPGLPVLFMSGYDASITGLDLQDGGRATFLQKPFTLKELAEHLEELFGPADRGRMAQPG
ncbi:MAG TPA: response regulator [Polyangiaceae bacterium]